ncbi:siderophore-interacting protein [Blastococcus sp. CT_GayMR19]|uniref:siderophore-interacting protein n=1 Tax=Blastococcus sp. CT_GayMR19 TaxID=2559608 RepID=UPI0010740230|nr:siderophore-interacting protein [Blastococcus sp. CT_GayMR19]TFV79244.1 siderophore-interacting protein [Blastococcus sp. CT_GayMR19]
MRDHPQQEALGQHVLTVESTGWGRTWSGCTSAGSRSARSRTTGAPITDPGGGYAPDADVPWHVFAGDLSALPAIAAALEAPPRTARGVVLLEIADPADIVMTMDTHASVEVRWLVNTNPADVGFLARAVDPAGWPAEAREPGGVQVFARGERESIKAVRRVLRDVPRERLSISGYWARGRTEDVFQAEKREPVGRIE